MINSMTKINTHRRGGARQGAGRPEIENPKLPYNTRLAHDLIDYLRSADKPASQIIDAALRDYIKKNT